MGNKAHIKIDEEKQLLLKELCTRLPYHVKVKVWLEDGDTEEGPLDLQHNYGDVLLDAFYYKKITKIKPYLRPMLSMTEEERNEMKKMLCPTGTGSFDEEGLIIPMSHFGDKIHYDFMSRILEWLNARHFDHQNLIEKGLALEAPDGMYKIKTE